MVDVGYLAFNIAAFVSSLFLLEHGADIFVDHTAAIAKRWNVSSTLIGLLTCGGEWEELVVIVLSMSQKRSSLALGNVIGSSIANVLGSFGIGLFFAGRVHFDRSSRIYAALLLALSSCFLLFLVLFSSFVGRLAGILLTAGFVVYVSSVGSMIYRGVLAAPESVSDSDSSSDSSDSSSDDETPTSLGSKATEFLAPKNPRRLQRRPPRQRPMRHHIWRLITGFCALCVASHVVSHTAAGIGEQFSLPGTVVGTTIVSIATSIPEKMVAIVGGRRKQPGILVANTVGSNIFLATLCAGVLFLGGDVEQIRYGFTAAEVITMWCTSALVCTIVMLGANRWVGVALLCLYVSFLAFEISSGRGLDDD